MGDVWVSWSWKLAAASSIGKCQAASQARDAHTRTDSTSIYRSALPILETMNRTKQMTMVDGREAY
jgi:hypothetical protein